MTQPLLPQAAYSPLILDPYQLRLKGRFEFSGLFDENESRILLKFERLPVSARSGGNHRQPVAAAINYFVPVSRNRNFTIRQRTRIGVAFFSQVTTGKVTKFRSLSVRLRAV